MQPLPRCDGRWPVSRHDAVAELDEDIALVQAELDAADHAAKDALARVEAGDENVTADDLPRLRGLGEFLNARLITAWLRPGVAQQDADTRSVDPPGHDRDHGLRARHRSTADTHRSARGWHSARWRLRRTARRGRRGLAFGHGTGAYPGSAIRRPRQHLAPAPADASQLHRRRPADGDKTADTCQRPV